MAKIFGKTYRREELMRLTGDISQIAGTKQYELLEGKGRGVRAVDFWTGTGFVFTILLDRGMDISEARYCGRSLCWRSPAGDVHPHFFDPRSLDAVENCPGCRPRQTEPTSPDSGQSAGRTGESSATHTCLP